MQPAHEVLKEVGAQGRRLRESIPDVYSTYISFNKAAMGAGELSARTKQLIALAIAVSKECDGCIASHARAAAAEGATRQEVAEALGVTIVMNGGPGTVWAPRAMAAFEAYATDAAAP